MRIFIPLVGVAILFRDIHPAIAVVGGLIAVVVFASTRDFSAAGRYSLLLFAIGVCVLAANKIFPFAGAMPAGLLCVALSGIRLNTAEAALSPPVEVEVADVAPVAPAPQAQVQAQVQTRVAVACPKSQTLAPSAPRRAAQKPRLRTRELIDALYE